MRIRPTKEMVSAQLEREADALLAKAQKQELKVAVEEFAAEVQEALGQFYARTLYEQHTANTPLHELIAAEEGAEDEFAVRNETLIRVLEWLAQDGPHPIKILRRLFCMGVHMGVAPFSLLTVRERGRLLGDSHGAEHWLLQRVCVDLLRRKGAKSFKAPGAKDSAASAAYALAQTGNQNRKRKTPTTTRARK